MSSVAPVSSANARYAQAPTGSPQDCTLPLAAGPLSAEDISTVLLMLEGRKAEGSKCCAQSQLETSFALQAEQRARMQQAIREAREQQENASGWDSLCSTLSSMSEIASIAAAAATVATGGAGLPAYLALAGAAMSLGSTAGRSAGLDPSLCNALAVGGTALSLGSGAAGLAGGPIDADAASTVAARESRTGSLTMADAARVLRGTGGAAKAGAGASTMVAGRYHAQAARSDAQALDARHRVTRCDDDQKDVIDRLDEIAKSACAALTELIEMQSTAQASAMQVIHTIGRRS